MDEGNTAANVLLGAAVSIVVGAVVPLGPLFGGFVAGYLQGGDRSEGVRVGLYAGALAFLVSAVLVGLVVLVAGAAFLSGLVPVPIGVGGLALVVLVIAAVMSAAYFAGLSAVGGWIGNYVKYDTELDL